MEQTRGLPIASPLTTRSGADVAAATRDADAIARRVADDERAADEARLRYRDAPPPGIEPDSTIAPLLESGERPLARRVSAVVDRERKPRPTAATPTGLAGTLYVTSRRIVLVGRVIVTLPLGDIDEVVLSAERVLLAMRDGTGLAVDVDRPRLLRVEIAAARAAARRDEPLSARRGDP